MATPIVFTKAEFTHWRYEILSKTKGSNIHKITNKLGAIQGFMDLMLTCPEKIELYSHIIEHEKAEICRMINKN